MSTNVIQCESIIPKKIINFINEHSSNDSSIVNIINLLKNELNIDATFDKDIVKSYERDYSNIAGKAEALVRPSNDTECAICLYISQKFKIPLTISAGRTNLNGSATPMEGIVLSTEKMISPKVKVDLKNNTAISPVGIQLESLRNEIQFKTQKKLYYPVDPTSRNDAMVGGTLSCNASGFVPGEQGATRFWVYGLEIILPNGYKVSFNLYNSANFALNVIKNSDYIGIHPKQMIETQGEGVFSILDIEGIKMEPSYGITYLENKIKRKSVELLIEELILVSKEMIKMGLVKTIG